MTYLGGCSPAFCGGTPINQYFLNTANVEVKKLAEKHGQLYIDINRNLKDEQGGLKAEYTIEGMHINGDGYRAIYDDIMEFVKEK